MEPNNERKSPAGEQNELFKKQVFSDEPLRPAEPEEEETGKQHFETLTFDSPPCSMNALPRAKRSAKPHSHNQNAPRRRQGRRLPVLLQSR